ncbi:hypothetical protein WDU94_004242 [Cyamophila willieti]
MDEEEDEIDILGDFDLENLLTRRDRTQSSFSFSSNDNYSFPSSDWILDNNCPLFNVKSVLTSDQVTFDTPSSLFPSTESLEFNSNIWTEKEKTLLERGLDLFGKSYARLSQYIGTKNSSQVKNYLKNHHPTESLASASSTTSLNCLDVGSDNLDTIEVVISSEDTPPVPPPLSYTLSSHSSLSEGSLDSDDDSYMGSTTSTASESECNSIHVPEPPKIIKQLKTTTPKKKHYVKKKPKPKPPPVAVVEENTDEEEDDDLDYDNTNIIFKPRKLSKYHLMVKSGDQVLPSGEQVIRIKKDEIKSDSEVDVLESDDGNGPLSINMNPSHVDINTFNPNRGMKVKGIVQGGRRRLMDKLKEKPRPASEDINVDIEVDVVNTSEVDPANNVKEYEEERIPAKSKIIEISDTPLEMEDTRINDNVDRSKKRTLTKMNTRRKKIKAVSGRQCSESKSAAKSSTNLVINEDSIFSENTNVYLNKTHSIPSKRNISSNENSNTSADDMKSKTKKKKIVFEESQFRSERNKAIHVDDLLENYDFRNVKLIDHVTQMQRINQLGPGAILVREDRAFNNYISVEEIDYHRDFFLHNDPYFVMRFLKIRNYILREWSCKKPKYINTTSVRSGLKHCGSATLINRIHSYLELKGLINT